MSDPHHWIRKQGKRLKAIKLLGETCCDCKRNLVEEPWIAEFHHSDPNKKESNLSNLFAGNWNICWKEVSKCQLICSNCHSKKHFLVDRYNAHLEKIKEASINLDIRNKVDEDAVKRLIEEGYHNAEIARRLDCARSSITYVRRKLEL